MLPKRWGNCDWYVSVLKWLSGNGLSLDTCGRLCERVTPRSASSKAVAVALAFIGPPRSACRVSWPGGTLWLAMAEIEVTPFGWSHQLGDVPGPDLVRPFGQ